MTLLMAGFVLGGVFGVAARLGRFCLVRGLSERRSGHAAPALRAFALALAVAILASQALAWTGSVDLSKAQVVRSSFSLWGVLMGGLLFGCGMALARQCGARAVVLLAGGNLRALLVLLCLGLAAQASLTGVLVPVRQFLQRWGVVVLNQASLPQWVMEQGFSGGVATLGIALPLVLVLAWYALRARAGNGLALACAAVIGAVVSMGWWVSAHIGVDPFEPAPLNSLSFIGPVAEGLLYLQLAVGRAPSFGAAMVAGAFAGAFVAALFSRGLRWESFTHPSQLAASAAGGLLMGFGGVLAVGCSIGQGLSGLSTLAFASLPASVGIVAGALLTLRLQTAVFNQEIMEAHHAKT